MSHIPDSQLPTADGRQPTAISRANCCVLIISWRLADWSMLCREKSAGLTDYADVCAKVCPKREKVNRTERTPPLAGSMPGPAVTALGRRAAWTRAPIGCFGACWVLLFRCGDSWLFAAAMDRNNMAESGVSVAESVRCKRSFSLVLFCGKTNK